MGPTTMLIIVAASLLLDDKADALNATELEAVCNSVGGQCIAPSCCPYEYLAEEFCTGGNECCFHPPDCDWKSKVAALESWPQGNFGVISSVYDCPNTQQLTWDRSLVRITGKTDRPRNVWSDSYHALGQPSTSVFSLTFCSMSREFLTSEAREALPQWPAGSYCIFKSTGAECPQGFTEGNVGVSRVELDITLVENPPVSSDEDVIWLHFCCRQDDEPSTPILLPTPQPLMLIKMGSSCQELMYMRVQEEYFELDYGTTEDNFTIMTGLTPNFTTTETTGRIRMEFCYYEAYETCYAPEDAGSSYRGLVKINPQTGLCADQTTWKWDAEFGRFDVLVGHWCHNSETRADRPWCGEWGRVLCTIPQCRPLSLDYTAVDQGFPVRQKIGGDLTLVATDGITGTCSDQSNTYQPWYQLNLRRIATVVAVQIYDNSGSSRCWIRQANVYVGLTEYDFAARDGVFCARNFSVNSLYPDFLIRCVQLVQGQYVTLESHAYAQTDIYPAYPTMTGCMVLCEFTVYVGEDPDCGVPMKSVIDIQNAVVSVSSSDEYRPEDKLDLYDNLGWCADGHDSQPFVQLEFMWARTVTGLWTQGGNDMEMKMVTEFSLLYGPALNQLLTYSEHSGTTKVFTSLGDANLPIRHHLSHRIITRYLRLNILEWVRQACLRLKPIVCKESGGIGAEALVTASSTMGFDLHNLVDGILSTFASTKVELHPWVAISLDKNYTISGVTILRMAEGFSLCDPRENRPWDTKMYMGAVNHTVEGYPCQRWDVKSPQRHVQLDADFPFTNMTLSENHCRNPDGRTGPWCYTTTSVRWGFCEIPACGTTMTTSVYVGDKVIANDYSPGDLPSQTMCAVRDEFEFIPAMLALKCTSRLIGDTVIIQVVSDLPASISAYEVKLHFAADTGNMEMTTASDFTQVACSGEGYIALDVAQEEETSNLVHVTSSVWDMLPNHCPINSQECVIPTVPSSQNISDTYYILPTCRSADPQGVYGECYYEAAEPGVIITTSFYLTILDSMSSCYWMLQAPSGKYTSLNISRNQLYPEEISWTQGSYTVSTGECRDHLVVVFMDELGEALYDTEIFGAFFGVASSNKLAVQLNTCFRFQHHYSSDEIDLHSSFQFEDCPGCHSQEKCSGVTFNCKAECGTIMSPGFPHEYPLNSHCVWHITVENNGYIKLEFTHFDIFEDILPPCLRDLVEVKDVSYNGDETTLAVLCNTNQPKEPFYSSWNRFVIEFTSDAAVGAEGFQLHYTMLLSEISEEMIGEIYNPVCDSGWLYFNDHCYRLFHHNESLTQKAAKQDCQNMDSHLVSIKSEEEMNFIQFMLGRNTSQDEIEAYIDLARISVQDDVEDRLNDTVLFLCQSGEYILKVFTCDNRDDCFDGSDELYCNNTVITEDGHGEVVSKCPLNSLTCDDGSCISISRVCDTLSDCAQGEDEAGCIHHNCTDRQWRCDNGACIDSGKRCDLIDDCGDYSDEKSCIGCRVDVAFQCYDGSCIPRAWLCDGTVDCPGLLHEDESTLCVSENIASCADWRLLGHEQNTYYYISPQGSEPVEVECLMAEVPGRVITVIHSNLEAGVHVHGYESADSYQRNITYSLPNNVIAIIKDDSIRCEQHFRFECVFAEAFAVSHYIGFSGETRDYEYSQSLPSYDCLCRMDLSCKTGSQKCWCSQGSGGTDAGYFVDDDVRHDDIPIRTLGLEDTGSSHEYVNYWAGPLRCHQEYNTENLLYLCKNGQSYKSSDKCIYELDEFGVPRGCRDATHLELDCEEISCPEGYIKCPSGYCIGSWHVCDGSMDCAYGEDEAFCEQHDCPGMYKCAESINCIGLEHYCDGIKHCYHGDDERYCNLTCPETCTCNTLSYTCTAASLSTIPVEITQDVRYLDLSNNQLVLTSSTLKSYAYLIRLLLTRNGIVNIEPNTFNHSSNVLTLDLSENMIEVLTVGSLFGLTNLKNLHLLGNPLISVEPESFTGLQNIQALSLRSHSLSLMMRGTFQGLKNLKELDLSHNQIHTLETGIFDGLDDLQELNISNNIISHFTKSDFDGLTNLQYLESDDYMFCCFVNLPPDRCFPQKDVFSSCDDLMSNNILRAFLWILGMMSLIGNSFVIAWRLRSDDRSKVPAFLVTNLAVSDLLMGVYMISLASIDLYYKGIYIENSLAWRQSAFCGFIGTLGAISSEVSVLTLCVMTGDRLVNILWPFASFKLNMRTAAVSIAGIWLIVILLAVIPHFPGSYFNGEFYSRSGVCVSIHLTDEAVPGWEYSVAIFHGLNFVTFMFIFLVYSYIFNFIKQSGKASGGEQKRREMAAARKMTLIVVTDFLCWVPINIMGMMALSGVSIPGDIYAWIVVFLLPVNSAINPILYTISALQVKHAQLQELSTSYAYSTDYTDIVARSSKMEQSHEKLDDWLQQRGKDLHIRDVMFVVRHVAQVLHDMHQDGLTLGQWDPADIFILDRKDDLDVEVKCAPLPFATHPQGEIDDVRIFGQLTKHLLRMYTLSNK